ncbi:DUF3572 domain-containing protein [Vannielia litorea]|uniref:DUF3572 domain-containing protein n=1 Tax=Vannielia litorea TaxID=1217970 RepID=UPI001C9379E7|nr:DUF3572 domain-containing protein [Vannielia litorea]MBY6047792.1 DUF3572 domain-containing protein [Vannielia litorea]MBY6075206.1 DUF3572 domain-containing protein [Vannielia litorea]MBY6152271.1 DUF3572 domain-containing protein [Vannielia litorea]
MNRDSAETIGLQALAWLAGNDELLPVFLGSTGVSEAEVRARAAEPEFLASVLDFLAMDDAWVTGFCDAAGLKYTVPMQARMALPGGDMPSWT